MSAQTKKILGIVLIAGGAVLVMLGAIGGLFLFLPGFALIRLSSSKVNTGGTIDENQMLKEKPEDYPDIKVRTPLELLPAINEALKTKAEVISSIPNEENLSFEYLYRTSRTVHAADAERVRKNLMKEFSGAFNVFCMDEHTIRVVYLPA